MFNSLNVILLIITCIDENFHFVIMRYEIRNRCHLWFEIQLLSKLFIIGHGK